MDTDEANWPIFTEKFINKFPLSVYRTSGISGYLNIYKVMFPNLKKYFRHSSPALTFETVQNTASKCADAVKTLCLMLLLPHIIIYYIILAYDLFKVNNLENARIVMTLCLTGLLCSSSCEYIYLFNYKISIGKML